MPIGPLWGFEPNPFHYSPLTISVSLFHRAASDYKEKEAKDLPHDAACILEFNMNIPLLPAFLTAAAPNSVLAISRSHRASLLFPLPPLSSAIPHRLSRVPYFFDGCRERDIYSWALSERFLRCQHGATQLPFSGMGALETKHWFPVGARPQFRGVPGVYTCDTSPYHKGHFRILILCSHLTLIII